MSSARLPSLPAYRQSVEDVARALGADLHAGLRAADASERRRRWGPNELASDKPPSAWRRLFSQFRHALVLLLLVAAAISTVRWIVERDEALPYEALAILAVVLLNAAMGYAQESRAQSAVAALQSMAADEALVVRDGEPRAVPAAEVVPGDLVLIEEGDTIPADARVVESIALQTAEAPLTGESVPVSKDSDPLADEVPLGDRRNMLFKGTAATHGRGRAIVTETGMRTEMGRIAGLLQAPHDETTPLQRELDRTARLLGLLVLAIALAVIATALFVVKVQGLSTADVLILGVALGVAAVPEGLPAVVTAVLSIGVRRMARRNAIVRHLAAVETLGSATVIASDKTGTLTRNEMTVRVVQTASGRISVDDGGAALQHHMAARADPAWRAELRCALIAADRANNAAVHHHDGEWSVRGDPTEGALRVAARHAGFPTESLDRRLPRIAEIPFSSERKMMSTLHRGPRSADGHPLILFTKGAPDVLLDRCSHEVVGRERRALTPARRAELLTLNDALAGDALRTLGLAVGCVSGDALANSAGGGDASLEHDLAFAGLVGLLDPPRPESSSAVAAARRAGIRPLMITGDHARTAAVIARELGIAEDDRVITGTAVDAWTDDELRRAVREVSVYARVKPEHKLRLVTALQRDGDVVAMTGDGVNDAPALRTAAIGVAMGRTGTDVSREAADMVLADDNFSSIVAAVEEGRAIFANIRKFLRYLLACNIGEVLTMFAGVLLAGRIGSAAAGDGVVLPLLATQILWINLLTDGPPAFALGMEPPEAGLMRRPPRPPGERVITPRMWVDMVFMGLVMAVGTLAVFDASLPGGFLGSAASPHAGPRYAQTMAFNTLMLFQLFNTFNARAERRSAFVRPFDNRWLWGAVGLSVLLQVLVLQVPILQRAFSVVALSGADWLRCVVVASAVLWIGELRKLAARWIGGQVGVYAWTVQCVTRSRGERGGRGATPDRPSPHEQTSA